LYLLTDSLVFVVHLGHESPIDCQLQRQGPGACVLIVVAFGNPYGPTVHPCTSGTLPVSVDVVCKSAWLIVLFSRVGLLVRPGRESTIIRTAFSRRRFFSDESLHGSVCKGGKLEAEGHGVMVAIDLLLCYSFDADRSMSDSLRE
jgi:hypothetical protein